MSIKLQAELVSQYLQQIEQDYQLALAIGKHGACLTLPSGSIAEINDLIFIAICIKYETFAADLLFAVAHRRVKYNHPWAYTRSAAKLLGLDIKAEYTKAHDVWDYYNTLKHVNRSSQNERLKITTRYNLNSSNEILTFARDAIKSLINKFLPSGF